MYVYTAYLDYFALRKRHKNVSDNNYNPIYVELAQECWCMFLKINVGQVL